MIARFQSRRRLKRGSHEKEFCYDYCEPVSWRLYLLVDSNNTEVFVNLCEMVLIKPLMTLLSKLGEG